jgi:hypothetical protein
MSSPSVPIAGDAQAGRYAPFPGIRQRARGIRAVFSRNNPPPSSVHIMSASPIRSQAGDENRINRGSAWRVGVAGSGALVVPQPAAFSAAAEAQAQQSEAEQRGTFGRQGSSRQSSRHAKSLADPRGRGHRGSSDPRSIQRIIQTLGGRSKDTPRGQPRARTLAHFLAFAF